MKRVWRCLAATLSCLSAVLALPACQSSPPSTRGPASRNITVGAPGDPCIAETRDAGNPNYTCTADKHQELVCDPATSKLKLWTACRGPKGCSLEGNAIYCDQSTARPSEACHPADTHACSEDGGTELQCSPQLAWTTQRECDHGCQVKDSAVFCE